MTFAVVMLALAALELVAVGLLVRRARRRAAAVGTPVCGHSSCPGMEDDPDFPAGVCDLPAGHEGMHRQSGRNFAWDRPDPPAAAAALIEDVAANALADMYSFQRANFRLPETFGISAEAHAALRARWKRDLERSMAAEEARLFIASYAAGPLELYGIRVEVREDLAGAEVAVA